MIKKICYLSLLISWMLVIYLFSNQNGNTSASISYSFVSRIICFFNLLPSDYLIQTLHLIVRKCAHMSEYAILTFLLYKNLKLFDIRHLITFKVLFLCFIYACLDEFHQGFISGRSPSFIDVLIDMCGGILMILGIFMFEKVFIKK